MKACATTFDSDRGILRYIAFRASFREKVLPSP